MIQCRRVTAGEFSHPRDDDDALSAEPWFHVGPQDVFPEEWLSYLFRKPREWEIFLELHRDVVNPEWWTATRDEVRAGQIGDAVPYPQAFRFAVHFSNDD